jgi:imidazole glycerol-phosphate synthase subunit HisF
MNTRTMFYGSQPITFKNARRLRKEMTEAEKILWGCLSKRQLNGARFRKQHPVGDYIADFYCHEFKLVVEVDGLIHEQQKEYDEERSKQMEEVKVTVIRFTNAEVMCDLDSVVQKIKDAMK